MVVMILGFTALLLRQLAHTERERDHAEREALAAQQLSDFLVELFESSDPQRTGLRADALSARQILERGRERLLDELGDQPEVRARLLTTIGQVYVHLSLFQEAAPLVREGLEIREEIFGPDSVEVAESLQLLGSLLAFSRGPAADLEPLFRRAVEIRERHLGPDDLELTTSLRSLGIVYSMMSCGDEARAILDRVVRIRETRLGPEHADVGDVLLRLAHLESSQGRFEDALAQMERAVRISERDLGPEHPRMVSVLGQYARFYLDAGRAEEAAAHAVRALELAEQLLGPDHQFTAESLQTLARVHIAHGRYREAEPLLTRALEVYDRKGSDFRVRVAALCLRAAVCRGLGRLEEAEGFFRRSLELQEARIGPRHPRVAEVLDDYASLLREMGREGEAEELEDRARAIRGLG